VLHRRVEAVGDAGQTQIRQLLQFVVEHAATGVPPRHGFGDSHGHHHALERGRPSKARGAEGASQLARGDLASSLVVVIGLRQVLDIRTGSAKGSCVKRPHNGFRAG